MEEENQIDLLGPNYLKITLLNTPLNYKKEVKQKKQLYKK